ncbi:AIPR family protein [Mycolicibacterium lacusdiani]|uniref:AIPR family protein n=1 Tax=Mycolicibacterium lacusdiani TaxID=2895283 RepID=UPI001F43E678|nr:AIPR family protein [Mycolicibacterium lacusdiani]
MPNDIDQFAEDLRQEVLSESLLEGAEMLRVETFTARIIQELTEIGELDDGQVAYFQDRGMRVGGYSLADEDRRLDLILPIYTQSVPPQTVPRDQVETGFTRMLTFFDRARGDLVLSIEESTAQFDMVLSIREMAGLEKVRLFVVTDGKTTVKQRPPETHGGLQVSFHVWDIRRLHRAVTSGQQQESINIDFVRRFGEPLPCLVVPHEWSDYAAHLAVVPGSVLADIYDEYGTRLLERNVRAFLQTRGKVNQGIRKTILNEPNRFLAYNNGLSATASAVKVVPMDNGGFGIASVKDLQIVNGGQTTASIHDVAKRTKADISHIQVPVKLTVVAENQLSEIVPLISRYANSQNKVNEADFEANDPFHVQIEKWSRSVWAPAVGGSQVQTRWFYERARGQYQDALAQESTPARKRMFKTVNPTSQKFTKTDLAKFENSWDQVPHLVSLGAEKNFNHFTVRLAQRGRAQATQEYFERLVAMAILFRRTERIVSDQQFGGYRANIVTYTIAYLAHRTSQQIDLDRIWLNQNISDALAQAIESTCIAVRDVLIDAPGSGNVTEWCKKAACWQRVRELNLPLPRRLTRELTDAVHDAGRMVELVSDALGESTQPLGKREILDRTGIPEEIWTQTIRTLLAQGRVEQFGSRRHATYGLTEVSTEASA